MGAVPSSTSEIRSRVPCVVSGGSSIEGIAFDRAAEAATTPDDVPIGHHVFELRAPPKRHTPGPERDRGAPPCNEDHPVDGLLQVPIVIKTRSEAFDRVAHQHEEANVRRDAAQELRCPVDTLSPI